MLQKTAPVSAYELLRLPVSDLAKLTRDSLVNLPRKLQLVFQICYSYKLHLKLGETPMSNHPKIQVFRKHITHLITVSVSECGTCKKGFVLSRVITLQLQKHQNRSNDPAECSRWPIDFSDFEVVGLSPTPSAMLSWSETQLGSTKNDLTCKSTSWCSRFSSSFERFPTYMSCHKFNHHSSIDWCF